jgi:hypothetical protein
MTDDTLAIWGVLREAPVASIDFDAVAARASDDITFRVKNRSYRNTAHDVVVSFDETSPAAPQLYLSADGITFTASLTLGDLPASAVSPILTLRRATPSGATGAYTCTLRAVATGGWTAPPTV